MVMSMDASSEQAMSSTIDESVAALGGADSPSAYRGGGGSAQTPQQHQDDEQNDDQHSKDSSQTIVLSRQHQQQEQQQFEEIAAASSVRRSESGEQAPMVLSRGSSLDGERRLAMNVDGEESLDESGSPASSKFGAASAEKKSAPLASGGRFAPTSGGQVDSLVAQMRDIVEGGGGGGLKKQAGGKQDKSSRQPKSSSDSLNNRDEQNTSKASLDSGAKGAGSNKRTRDSRCRHHHHHHHHGHPHRHHRPSVSGAGGGSGPLPLVASESTTSATAEAQSINSSGQQGAGSHARHPHHHHHHHHHHARNSSSAHRHHHHHRHHAHHHAHQHHRQHHQQQQQQEADAPDKRHSIQRPSLALIDPTGGSSSLIAAEQRHAKIHGSQSSVSSLSSTAMQRKQLQQHQHDPAASQCQQQGNNPNQQQQGSNPESKSSETPSDERNFEASSERQQEPASGRASFQHGYAHHHHHHHHCHHRAGHERRLVLDVSSNQEPEGQQQQQQQQQVADGAELEPGKKRGPLQEIASGNEQQSARAARHHTHHGHSHPLHHHHHHHHHHATHHAAQCSHKQAAESQQQQQQQEQQSKEGQDLQQQARAHHQRHHRHHRHAHHHAHHCKQHRRRNSKQACESKNNVSEMSNQELSGREQVNTFHRAGSEANHENKMSAANSRRMSSVSNRNQELTGESKSMIVDQEIEETPKGAAGNEHESGRASDEVVEMEMSPSNEARAGPMDKQLVEPSATSDANLITSIEIIPGNPDHRATTTVAITRGQPPANNSSQFQETSYKIDGHIEHKENRHDGARQNRLVRQMSSQSSKKSQKSDMGAGGSGAGDQKSQRHAPDCSAQQPLQSVINQQPSEPKQVIESSVPTDRRCRLCWCCCCPCSALTNREGVTRAVGAGDIKALADPATAPTTRFPSLPNVPLEEIRAWGESFDKLMRCKDARKVFQDFLRCEYSEENILFWSACEELKKERDSKSIAAKARDIYEDYISILSSKEVSLDSRVRDVINSNIKKPTSNIFDEAQLQIYTLMHRDSYPRFINSAMYKKLAKIQNNSSRKSSS